MDFLKTIPRALWKTWFALNFAAGLLLLYPLFYLTLSNRKFYPLTFKLKRFWAHWILFGAGIFYTAKREIKKIPQPCVFCANHSSYLDIVLSYCLFDNYFVFMGKAELAKAPLFNIFFKDMNILVNRKSTVDSHKAYIRSVEEIVKGNSLFLFPEGTISKNGNLIAFKNGAFKLAIDKQVPVVPVTFLNTYKHLQNGGFFKAFGKPGLLRAIVHKPIETKGLSEQDLVSLKDQVRTLIENDIKEYAN